MVERQEATPIGNSMYSGERNARLYDAVYALTETKDIPFWLNIAKQIKAKNILEIGVGTGRVAIPLAQKGFRVTGLDTESSMLKVAQEKISKLSQKTQERLDLIQADARNFSLNKKFDLVICPLNTFCHFFSKEDQVAVLKNMRNHADSKKGVVVIDTFSSFAKIAYRKSVSSAQINPEDKLPFKDYIAIDMKSERVALRSVRDHDDSENEGERFIIDRESKLFDLKTGKLLDKNRSIFSAAALNIFSTLKIMGESGFDAWQVMSDYKCHPNMDAVGLMVGADIKGTPSEKMIIIAGPGYDKIKGTPLSPQEAERLKKERKDIGLEITINGQNIDPVVFQKFLKSLKRN
jgi:SAM-dependent methyltransferase